MSDELTALQGADRKTLTLRWNETFQTAVPSRIGEDFIRRALAYELQMRSAAPELKAIQQKIGKVSAGDTVPAGKASGRLKLGSRLIREWNGSVHQVTVTAEGFLYRDQRYGSLSEIAREITGTRWSGPAFFGLKTRRRA